MSQKHSPGSLESQGHSPHISTSQTKINTQKQQTAESALSVLSNDAYHINSSVIFHDIEIDFYTNSTKIKIEIGTQSNANSGIDLEIPLGKFNPKNEKLSDYFYIELLENGIFFINDKRFGPYYYFQKNKDNSISQIQMPLSLQNVKNTDIFDEKPKAEYNGNLYFYNREKSCVEFLEEEVEQIILYNDLYIVQKGKNHIVIFYEGEIYRLKFWYFCKFIQEQLLVKPFLGKPKIIDGFENLKQYLKQ